ncbi:MAG: hypothetical protein HC892_09950 [Saprospiraceae bacterium]|nr:hypothetical protein [Saprospiraceae bacterium]
MQKKRLRLGLDKSDNSTQTKEVEITDEVSSDNNDNGSDAEIENEGYNSNPLLQPLVERDYAKSNVRIIGGDAPFSVDEPLFKRPVIDLRDNGDAESNESSNKSNSNNNSHRESQPQQPQQERGQVTNPDFKEMSPKAQKESARALAKTIVGAYANMNNIIRDHLVKTDINKLQTQALQGKFDMDVLTVELPMSETETIQVGEVIQQTNSGADEVFTCSDEFNEETEELWVEILKERGIGMTPIQRLTYLYVEDIGKKGLAAWGIWKTNKEILATAEGILKQLKSSSQPIATEYNAPSSHVSEPKVEIVEDETDEVVEVVSKPKRRAAKRKPKRQAVKKELREVGEANTKTE